MINKNPAFNLKAVLRETGLAADSLRAWERRYGLPMPQRTGGGHRLYSQYDIETIKWLKTRQAEGLSISRAVDLWNEISASGIDPLAESAPASLRNTQTNSASNTSLETSIDAIRTQWLIACMSYDEVKAEQTLNKAFSMFQIEDVCIEVLQKGLAEIGNLWLANQITVLQEHFASGLAIRRIETLLSATPAPSRPQTIIVGCSPNEWHTLTPLLFSLLLRRRGLQVIYLGANVPTDDFAETALKVKADLVVMVSQTLLSTASLQHTAFSLSNQNVAVAFGGGIFNLRPSIVEYIPGYFLGNEIDSAIFEVEQLLKSKKKLKAPTPISEQNLAALHGFSAKRTMIENSLKKNIQPLSINPEELNNSIHYVGNNIIAALNLGDIGHLTLVIGWIKALLKADKYPSQDITQFIHAYSDAVDEHINGQGEPIKNWLLAYKEPA